MRERSRGQRLPLSLVGGAPLVELRRLSPKPGVRIFGKIEGQNPTGSIKDRIALALVERAESEGRIAPGDTIVEASSGNTAIALAFLFVAKQKGYRAHVVIPEGVAPSIGDLLGLLDAEVTWCRMEGGMGHAHGGGRRPQPTPTGYKLLGPVHRPDQRRYALCLHGPRDHRGAAHRRRLRGRHRHRRHHHGRGTAHQGALAGGAGRPASSPSLASACKGSRTSTRVLSHRSSTSACWTDASSWTAPPASKGSRTSHGAEGLFAGASSGAVLDTALRVGERMDEGVIVRHARRQQLEVPARPAPGEPRTASGPISMKSIGGRPGLGPDLSRVVGLDPYARRRRAEAALARTAAATAVGIGGNYGYQTR